MRLHLFIWLMHYCQWCSRVVCLKSFPSHTELCPDRNFCQTNATQMTQQHEKGSCCQVCSCSPDCYIMGNCCYDAPIPDNMGEQLACTDVTTFLNNDRDITRWDNLESAYYRIFTSCPTWSTVGGEGARQCSRSAQDFTPVSSMDGSRVYGNRYCAFCHGERDVVPWNMYTDCYDLLDLTFQHTQARDYYIWENCELTARPPSEHFDKHVRCHNDTIQACNVTGQWHVYNGELERACNTSMSWVNSNYFVNSYQGYTGVYENIYCYYCNLPYGYDMADNICHTSNYYDVEKNTLNTILVLLTREVGTAKQKEVNSQCPKSDSVYDPYLKMCRDVYCPATMLSLNAQCHPIGDIKGVGFLVDLVFVSTSGLRTPNIDKAWIRTEQEPVLNKLNAHLKNVFRKCDRNAFCVLFLHIDRFGEFYVRLTVQSIGTCYRSLLLRYLIDHVINEPTEFSVTTANTTNDVVMVARLAQSQDDNMLQEDDEFIGYRSISLACVVHVEAVTRSVIELCPRIQLNVNQLSSELKLSNLTIVSLLDAQLASSPADNGTFRICLSKYLSIMSANIAHGLFPDMILWTVIALLAVLERKG